MVFLTQFFGEQPNNKTLGGIYVRKTKIICTLGPATDSPEMIRALIKGGMNAARFNFSHGTHAEQLERLTMFASVRDAMGKPVASILDTKGPEIRIKSFSTKTIELAAGDTFTLTTDDIVGDSTKVSVTYTNLHEEVAPGQTILIDDGLVGIEVKEISGHDIICNVVNGGTLSANKSINIPGAHIQLPALTERDIDDIVFGIQNDFDFIAASFIRKADDVRAIRKVLQENGGERVRIIAKIENQEGVDNLDEIISVSDGIMVARGDLGVEIPAEKVPVLQKEMIRKGLIAGKIVITATQMLDSMIRNPRPTRAEVSDVANAVFDGTSVVMLSGETASGKYPLQALAAMNNIVCQAEAAIHYWDEMNVHLAKVIGSGSVNDATTHACCLMARDLDASAIVTTTNSGHTARMISRFRPACPIAALTMHEKVRRQLNLSWGVQPFLTGEITSTDRIFSLCNRVALTEKVAKEGETIVVTAGVPLGQAVATNLIKAHVVESED